MIKSIHIQNYALIDRVEIDLERGFSVITGETGAGKSILLGAIGLTVGNRADASVIMDKERKCVAEVTHDVAGYPLQAWFESNDLEHAAVVIARREIYPDGRSRAFINDTPVTSKILKELGEALVDIHSQHQSSLIARPAYQMEILDHFRGNLPLLERYRHRYKLYRQLTSELHEHEQRLKEEAREEEFIRFQLSRLDTVNPRPGEQQELERELALLSNAEAVKAVLDELVAALIGQETPVVQVLRSARRRIAAIASVLPEAATYDERLQSAILELQDIADEVSRRSGRVECSPERLQATRDRLDVLHDLLHKYKVENVDALIRLREHLAGRLQEIESSERRTGELSVRLQQAGEELEALAGELHRERLAGAAPLEAEACALLVDLGIKHARFSVIVEPGEEFSDTGKDHVTFLFSANKNHEPGELARVASGGEISRLMLAMKYILSRARLLPVIIFDEIDTGVSGEIAHRVATMLRRLSARVQVVCISHLPQVAAAGSAHFKVYKQEGERSLSRVKLLAPGERVTEIAGMTSGSSISPAALENARLLLESYNRLD